MIRFTPLRVFIMCVAVASCGSRTGLLPHVNPPTRHTHSTLHFDIRVPMGMDDLAMRVAGIAESEYECIADLLAHDMRRVIAIRVAPVNQTLSARHGAATIIPFNGSYADCKRRLALDIALSFQTDILQGTPGTRELSSRRGIPQWMRRGMARYISEGERPFYSCAIPAEDGPSRDAGHSLATDADMAAHGPAFFRFLDSRFGGRAMGDLLREFGETGDIDTSLAAVTGMRDERLWREWSDYCASRSSPEVDDGSHGFINIPVAMDRSDSAVGMLAVSPDGRRIAILERGSAHPVIRIHDTGGGALEKTIGITGSILRQGNHVVIHAENNLSWDNHGVVLLFAVSGRSGPALYMLDTRSSVITEMISLPFSVVMHPSFSPDGNRIVFSAVGSSSSDIYIVDRKTAKISRVTDDAFFESHPSFTPDGQRVLYSSNRSADSGYGHGQCSIFVHDLRTGKSLMAVDSGGNDMHASASPDGVSILYTADRRGWSSICRYNAESGENLQLKIPGLLASRPRWFPDGRRFACFIYKKSGWGIIIGTVPISAVSGIPITDR